MARADGRDTVFALSDDRANVRLRRSLATVVGWLALLSVLCMPALHAVHLRLAESEERAEAQAATNEHPTAPAHHHDAARCAICASAHSIQAGTALFDLTVACAFDAPATFPPALYVAPPTEAFVPTVAIPRGPPARA